MFSKFLTAAVLVLVTVAVADAGPFRRVSSCSGGSCAGGSCQSAPTAQATAPTTTIIQAAPVTVVKTVTQTVTATAQPTTMVVTQKRFGNRRAAKATSGGSCCGR